MSKTDWVQGGAIALGASLVTGVLFGLGGAFSDSQPDLSKVATKEDLKDVSLKVTDLSQEVADVKSTSQTTADEVLKEDIWESSAEVLALGELEDRDYKELRKWLVDEFGDDFLTSDDYKDVEIDKVVVKDKEVTDSDTDDQDAEVELELRVYYEDEDGEDVRRNVLATITIEDGEVEDIEFEELH